MVKVQKIKNKSDNPPTCLFCPSAFCYTLGHIPNSDMFAGRVLESPLNGGAVVAL